MAFKGSKRQRDSDYQSGENEGSKKFMRRHDAPKEGYQNEATRSEGRLPIELKEYIRSVAENDEDAVSSDELYGKCIEEFKGSEIALCCDPDASHHLESICHRSISICLQYFDQFFMNKRKAIVGVFSKAVGSRCLESIIYELRNHTASDDTNTGRICGVLGQLGEILSEEFDTVVSSRCSTHIIRAYGRMCCGLGKPERQLRGTGGSGGKNTLVNQSEAVKSQLFSDPTLKSYFEALTMRVLDWQSMHAYYYQESISCLVQEYIQLESAVSSGKDRKALEQLLTSAVNSEDGKAVIDHWTDKQSSRAWESIIKYHPDDDLIAQLYQKHLKGRLEELAMHPFANFPLQRLLERCNEKELACEMLDELCPIIGQLWTSKRSGVLVATASTCAKCSARQKAFYKALRLTARCGRKMGKDKHVKLVSLFVQFRTLDSFESSDEDLENAILLTKDTITPHGSALVQHLLHFRKPLVEKGLANMSRDQLATLASHPAGSHIFDAFFASETVTTKPAMIEILKDPSVLIPLACDKYGSRVVETIWAQSDVDKSWIAQLLTSNDAMSKLSRSPYGKIIWTKYQLERFKVSPKEWRKFWKSLNEKKRLLTDLIK